MGFAILPPATTYSRVWRAEKKIQLVAWWNQTNRFATCIDDNYMCFMEKPLKQYILSSTTFAIPWSSPDNMIIENFSHG